MFRNDSQVNPHPALDARGLAQISTETLREMVNLRLAGVPPQRVDAAGVPHLNDLTIELLRRDADPPTIAVTPVRSRDAWILAFECPWCPRRRGRPRVHIHGGGLIGDQPEGGHRVSHCHAEGAPDGYFLAIVEADSAAQR